MAESVHTPRQKRSRETQERLLDALESLLEDRFFEHITIQDIAAEAGVAVGTIYRRFRDKESMLPVLYRRLDGMIERWAAEVWDEARLPTMDLRQRLHRLVAEHVRFYQENAPILRTLYLHVRLDRDLVDPAVGERRKTLYMALLGPVLEALGAGGGPPPTADRVRCFILLLLAPVIERCLFPDNTPASTLRMSDRRFVNELTEALYRYLPGDGAA